MPTENKTPPAEKQAGKYLTGNITFLFNPIFEFHYERAVCLTLAEMDIERSGLAFNDDEVLMGFERHGLLTNTILNRESIPVRGEG